MDAVPGPRGAGAAAAYVSVPCFVWHLPCSWSAVAQAVSHPRPVRDWSSLIAEGRWRIYREVLDEAEAREIPFAIGGAFAVATYTGHWRDTKDIDLYVLPPHRERMIAVLGALGFTDYYKKLPYDRWWIYRGTKDDTIVDVIWAMANHRQRIDGLWMSGRESEIHGRCVKVLPPEALLWDKLYILQRDRCDWPDVLNLLYATGADLDWRYVLERIGADMALLAGALAVFRWIAPGRAGSLPPWLWERVGLAPGAEAEPPGPVPEIDARRASLLDTRPWFRPERGKT